VTGIIRNLKREDRDQWQQLWRGYQAFYKADLSKDEDALFERLLTPSRSGPYCLVYEEGDTLLGLTQYLFHASTWGADRCYLNDLFTLPASRGKGVGRALIEAVAKHAGSEGAAQVYWLTQDFNKDARVLYDKVAGLTPFIKYAMDPIK